MNIEGGRAMGRLVAPLPSPCSTNEGPGALKALVESFDACLLCSCRWLLCSCCVGAVGCCVVAVGCCVVAVGCCVVGCF